MLVHADRANLFVDIKIDEQRDRRITEHGGQESGDGGPCDAKPARGKDKGVS